jgi:hypothetical protein
MQTHHRHAPDCLTAEVAEDNSGGEEKDLELGLCFLSNKQQKQSPAPCRILTAGTCDGRRAGGAVPARERLLWEQPR